MGDPVEKVETLEGENAMREKEVEEEKENEVRDGKSLRLLVLNPLLNESINMSFSLPFCYLLQFLLGLKCVGGLPFWLHYFILHTPSVP